MCKLLLAYLTLIAGMDRLDPARDDSTHQAKAGITTAKTATGSGSN